MPWQLLGQHTSRPTEKGKKKKERVDWCVPAISLLFSSITYPSVLSLLRSQRYRRLKGTDLSQSYCLVKAELWPAAMKVTAGAATSAHCDGLCLPAAASQRVLRGIGIFILSFGDRHGSHVVLSTRPEPGTLLCASWHS